jgi:hypothetical protein
MFRTLRAFAWLRWRVLMNSLERRGTRDVVERFSVGFEQIAPLLTLLVMIPSCVGLSGLGAYAGWTLARGDADSRVFEIVRYLLLAAMALCIVGPLMMPAAERTSAVRLLLLPIRRSLLYAAQCMSTSADPWILFALALLLGLPLGMVAGGAPGAAVITAIAGMLLMATLIGLTLVVTLVIHLMVRDRRRGELLALILIVGLPMIGMLPGLLQSQRRETAAERIERRQRAEPSWWASFERRALAVAPPELYTAAARYASDNAGTTVRALSGLLAAAMLVHAVGLSMFGRVLSSPAGTGSARTASTGVRTQWRIPGVSPGISAVAINQLRLALRTPRGRATLLSPLAIFVMFAAMMWRSGTGMEFGPIRLRSGTALAAFASFVSLLSIFPIAANQFAIDRAGLTMTLLAPLDTPALLRGKAIGNALIAGIPAGIATIGAAILFPSANFAIWLSIPLTLVATYLLIAPVAAVLSAIFPRAVDLNSIGRGSNAHGAAGLLGTLTALIAGVPCAMLILLAARVLHQTALAPIFLLVWVGICLAVDVFFFRMAAAIFDRRKENLAMMDRG